MKLLVVVDDRVAGAAMRKVLERERFDFACASDAASAVAIIREQAIRIAIIDWALHAADPAALCRTIRSLKKSRYVHIVAVCPRKSMGDVIDAMNAGADDYLLTPFDGHELHARIDVGRRMLGSYDRLVDSQKKLLRLTREDPVTGLMNRRALFDVLLAELNRAVREGRPITVILVGLAGTRAAASGTGTPADDDLVREAGERLARTCRPYDTIGRYDAEEFMAILPNTRQADAETIAVRIRDALAGVPYQAGDDSVQPAFGIGVHSISPDKRRIQKSEIEHLLDALILKVRAALRQANANGDNQIAVQ